MRIDFGRTSSDYARHRQGFPDAFYALTTSMGVACQGRTLLDVGTGTGTLARGFARRGATVIGIDPSAEMLGEARALAAAECLEIDFRQATAEDTGVPAEHVDIVTAGQCWHWFDRPAAAAHLYRILKPGGYLILGHFDWIPLPGNVAAETEALIVRYNPGWRGRGGTGVYPRWFADAANAGFGEIQSRTVDELTPYTHEAWRGRVRASAGVAASLDRDAVERFDSQLAGVLAERFPEDPLAVHHRIFALVAKKPIRPL